MKARKSASNYMTCLTLCLSAAFVLVLNQPSFAARLVDESFEGVGYEESWNEGNPGSYFVLDEDASIPGSAPPEAGSECLRAYVFGSQYYAYSVRNLGVEKSKTFTRIYLYVKNESLGTGEVKRIAWAKDNNGSFVWTLRLKRVATGSSGLRLRYRMYNNGGWSGWNTTIYTSTWYRAEVKYDNDSDTWAWRLGGAELQSGSLTGTHRTGIKKWAVGPHNDGNYRTTEVYYDLVAVDDSDWVGEEGTGQPWSPVDEGFEGSGYEQTWNERINSGNTVDEDATPPGTPPTGAGSDCLKTIALNSTLSANAYAYQPNGEQDTSYVRGYLYVGQEGFNEGNVMFTLALFDSNDERVAGVDIGQQNGLKARYRYFSDGNLQTAGLSPIALNTWYRMEYKYDVAGMTWEFRIDGVTQASGNLSGVTGSPSQMLVGIYGYGGSSTMTLYTDLAAWADDGWIGEGGVCNTITVCKDGSCDRTNIQNAIDAANACDTVQVRDGSTYGGFTMKSGVDVVSLYAEDPQTYSRPVVSSVITFGGYDSVSNCTLDGFKVTGGASTEGQINVVGSTYGTSVTGVTIKNCYIDGANVVAPAAVPGIRLNGYVAPTIQNTTIVNYRSTGISTGLSPAVIRATGFPIRIEGCTIHDSTVLSNPGLAGGAGIRITGNGAEALDVTVSGNKIYNNPLAGIRLDGLGAGSQITMDNNEVYSNGTGSSLQPETGGIYLDDVASATVTRNKIHDNTLAGVSINGNDLDQTITVGGSWSEGNEIYDNGAAGVAFGGDVRARGTFGVNGNRIYSNDRGGIFVARWLNGTVTISQNDIYQNGYGGIGIYNDCELIITNNNIRNHAIWGGIHTGAEAHDLGGFNGNGGASLVLTIKKNKIHDNGAGLFGGGIDVRHATGTISNNLVYRNNTGGIRYGNDTDITYNTVVYNGLSGRGGGIVFDDPAIAGSVNDPPQGMLSSDPTIQNNISAYNTHPGLRIGGFTYDGVPDSGCPANPNLNRDDNLLYSNNGWTDDDCNWQSTYPNRRCVMMNYSACAFLIDVTGNSADFWTLINPNDVIEDPQFTNPGNDDFHSPSGKGAYAGPDPLDDNDIPPFD